MHTPLDECVSDKIAKEVALKGISVAPTLVMMKGFCDSIRFGYKKKDYINAVNTVKAYYRNGVNIITGTDSNGGFFTPKVHYGKAVVSELNLLLRTCMSLEEVLKSCTSGVLKAFAVDYPGNIKTGYKANIIEISCENEKINFIKRY